MSCIFQSFCWENEPKYVLAHFLENLLRGLRVRLLPSIQDNPSLRRRGRYDIPSIFLGGQQHYRISPAAAFFSDFCSSAFPGSQEHNCIRFHINFD